MRKFGLIGYPLSHSFSKQYFTDKFKREKIADCSYELYPIENINELPELLKREPALCGLNVTIPYKEQLIPYLHQQSALVEQTGACNCVAIRNDTLIGYNTDVIGFRASLLKALNEKPGHALVLGSGGASKAVRFVLEQLAIPFTLVSRRAVNGAISYDDLSNEMTSASELIINCTPLGMYPHVEDAPPLQYEAIGPRHLLFDLIYNPAKTRFLLNGEEKGANILNGEEMLILQAEESWKIWNQE